MVNTLYVVKPEDNVATAALDDVALGTAQLRGGREGTVELLASIPFGHKAAIADIEEGAAIIKYGVQVAVASRAIRCGEYVHIHNAKSMMDVRSNEHTVAEQGTAENMDREYTL